MRRATDVSYSVGQPIAILSHDPRTLPPRAKYRQEGLLTGGPQTRNLQSEENERWLTDANLRKKFVYEFLNKKTYISGKLVPGVEPGKGGFRTVDN
jgi:hypothetical protein